MAPAFSKRSRASPPFSPKHGFGLLKRKRGLRIPKTRSSAQILYMSRAFYTVGVHVVTHPHMVLRAREIARQFHQERIYDSLYAALAELRGCQFWTADKVFYDAVKEALPFVRYLPEYLSGG